MLRFFLLLILFPTQTLLFSQVVGPITPVVRHLMEQKGNVQVITSRFGQILPKGVLPHLLENEDQFLVHNSSGLYLGVPGSGYLFRLTDSAGYLKLVRVDSTYFTGYNFYAAHFTARDTIYSLGGYGFWRSNGLLRFYKPNQFEWSLKRTNMEIPVLLSSTEAENFWLDPVKAQLYLAGSRRINEGLIKQGRVDSTDGILYKLDIGTGVWSESGLLSKEKIEGYNSPWGLLAHNTTSSWHLLDFIGNRNLKALNETNSELEEMHSRVRADLIYFVDSTLYFGSLSIPRFDSIQLSINDFEATGKKIYEPKALTEKISWLWWLLIPLALLVWIIVGWRGRKRSSAEVQLTSINETASPTDNNSSSLKSNHNSNLFNQTEAELLKYFVERSRDEYLVSLEEINRILGLSGKNSSVQKKNRSEVISAINANWARKSGSRTPLVNRKRSEFDKRVFEYFIHPSWVDVIEKELTLSSEPK